MTETIAWDGPENFETLRESLSEREGKMARGEICQFTIIDVDSKKPIGSADLRWQDDPHAGEIGLWLGEPFQGQGIGTHVIGALTHIGFVDKAMNVITAGVFEGNIASRRAFEKNGYTLSAINRGAVEKAGKRLDEWVLSLSSETYFRNVARAPSW